MNSLYYWKFQTINEWVEKKTNAKIKNLISPDMLTVATTLALVNAIYFKGDWATKFDVHRTMKKQFHVAENQNREVKSIFFSSFIINLFHIYFCFRFYLFRDGKKML